MGRRMRPMGDPADLGEIYSPIKASTIAILTMKCTKITDLNLCGARLSQEAITLICNQITPTLVAINLAREYVKDENVGALINRCRNMRYINLAETRISYGIIHPLVVGWRYSMRDLTLPEQLARQLKLFSSFGPYDRREEFATLIKSMPRLERLHVGHYRFEQSDIMARRDHVVVLCKMFPHLLINPSPFGNWVHQITTQPENSTMPSGHKVGPCDIKITRPTPPYRHLGTTTTEVETGKKNFWSIQVYFYVSIL